MKALIWILISCYVALGVALVVIPAGPPAPWFVYLAMPIIGAVLQLIADTRGRRYIGLFMTILGLLIAVGLAKDEERSRQRARFTVWEMERRQAEHGAAHLPSAPQPWPSEGAR